MPAVRNLQETWENVRRLLVQSVGRERFDRWLSSLVPVGFNNGCFTIGCANRIVLEWIEARYLQFLNEAVREAVGSEAVEVKLIIEGSLFREHRRKTVRNGSSERSPEKQAGLLDRFVVGRENEPAYRAVLQVARGERAGFNPLVIVGPPGTGKTHLVRGLAEAYSRSGGKKVRYLSSYDFASSFRASLLQHRTDRFRAYFRSLDLLILDDLQGLAGKKTVQEEFLHTFDALLHRGGSMVVASAAAPSAMKDLDKRLRQRLLGGLVVRLREPAFPTRLTIAKREAAKAARPLGEGVAEFLARNVKRNIRDLISAVTRLSAYAALEGRHIGVTEAQKLLAEQLQGQGGPRPAERVLEVVCSAWGVSREELQGRLRPRRISDARKAACYLLRRHTDLSLCEIGIVLGGRKASTVQSAVRDVERDIAVGDPLGKQVEALSIQLGF